MDPRYQEPRRQREKTFVKLADGSVRGFYNAGARKKFVKDQIALQEARSSLFNGFPFELRRDRRARLSGKREGEYSRGFFVDGYGEKLNPDDPTDMQFAVAYRHPCKGGSVYRGELYHNVPAR